MLDGRLYHPGDTGITVMPSPARVANCRSVTAESGVSRGQSMSRRPSFSVTAAVRVTSVSAIPDAILPIVDVEHGVVVIVIVAGVTVAVLVVVGLIVGHDATVVVAVVGAVIVAVGIDVVGAVDAVGVSFHQARQPP